LDGVKKPSEHHDSQDRGKGEVSKSDEANTKKVGISGEADGNDKNDVIGRNTEQKTGQKKGHQRGERGDRQNAMIRQKGTPFTLPNKNGKRKQRLVSDGKKFHLYRESRTYLGSAKEKRQL